MDTPQEKIIHELKELKEMVAKSSPLFGKWVTETQVKKYLEVGSTWLYEMRKANKIGYTKVGRTVYYKIRDIEKLLENNYLKGRTYGN